MRESAGTRRSETSLGWAVASREFCMSAPKSADREADTMPDSVLWWLNGYLYAKGIDEPTPQEFESAVLALEQYRLKFDALGAMN